MRIKTESERTAETAVPPKKPPAPSVEREPRRLSVLRRFRLDLLLLLLLRDRGRREVGQLH
jgi:hypothetical protein